MPLVLHSRSWKIFDAIVNMLLTALIDHSSKSRAFYFFKEMVYFYHFNRYYKNMKHLLLVMSEGYQKLGDPVNAILLYINAIQYAAVDKNWEVDLLGDKSPLRPAWHFDGFPRVL